MKTLKFAENLVPLVLSGEKTRTWRFFDEKNLHIGDTLNFLRYTTGEKFADAMIVHMYEKKFGAIEEADFKGHERFMSEEEMHKTYRGYYGEKLTPQTKVKIIDFMLL